MTPEELKNYIDGLLSEIRGLISDLTLKMRRHKHGGIESEVLNDGVRDVLISFETGEQLATRLYFPFAVQIVKIRGEVVKAIAGTDNGTITGANSTGNSAGGLITATASDPLATLYSVTPTTNYIIGKDGYYKLTSAKTTAGGKVLVSVEYKRL